MTGRHVFFETRPCSRGTPCLWEHLLFNSFCSLKKTAIRQAFRGLLNWYRMTTLRKFTIQLRRRNFLPKRPTEVFLRQSRAERRIGSNTSFHYDDLETSSIGEWKRVGAYVWLLLLANEKKIGWIVHYRHLEKQSRNGEKSIFKSESSLLENAIPDSFIFCVSLLSCPKIMELDKD